MQNIWLSKSAFLKGVQCSKHLALHKFKYLERDKVSIEQQALFDDGHDIENLARQLNFPNGMKLKPSSPTQWKKVISMTNLLLKNGQPRLYEGAIQHNGVMCAIDVIDNHGKNEISIFEIKRNPKVKSVYLLDMAIQYWIVTNAGYTVKQICLVHPEEEQDKNTPISFSIKEFTEEAISQQNFVQQSIQQQYNMLKLKRIPNVEMGEHCNQPYRCSFYNYCSKQTV